MKNTIVGMSLTRDNNNTIRLELEDNHSGDTIITVEMSLKELGLLITGMYGVKGVAQVDESAHIAEKREVSTIYCNKLPLNERGKQSLEVISDFKENYEPLGWVLQSDGTSSQQREDKHHYVIKKYIPVENPLEVRKYY